VFPGPPAPFGVVICYEGIFPDLFRQFVNNGARVMVNMTNDGWFGRTSGPYQHLAMYPFRAVEHRIAVVRAANTGISAIIDPYGRVLGELGLKQEGDVDGLLPEALPITKFVMWGRWIELAVLSLALVGYLAFSRWLGNQSGPPRNEGIAGI
jgi:apolipoprotein N-acyltransferase